MLWLKGDATDQEGIFLSYYNGFVYYEEVHSEAELLEYIKEHGDAPPSEAFREREVGDEELAKGGFISKEEFLFNKDEWEGLPKTLKEALGLNKEECLAELKEDYEHCIACGKRLSKEEIDEGADYCCECVAAGNIGKKSTLEHKADDDPERPPTTFKPYKVKPKDVDVPPAVPPATKGVEDLLERIHQAETSKVNIANDITAAQEQIEKNAGLPDITRQEQEALEQLSDILEAGKDSIVAVGDMLITLRDAIKTKQGKLTDAVKLKRIYEKFEGAEEYIKKSEAQVEDEIQRIRQVVEFPKPPKTSSLEKTSGILDWVKGLYAKVETWLDNMLNAEQLLSEAVEEVEA